MQTACSPRQTSAADERDRVHTSFKQALTATGRLSSTEPNLQNIPIKTELGREMRKFFAAEKEGYVLIDADYSQIELRLLAAISGDEGMLSAFSEGADIHTSTAMNVFGVSAEEVSVELRKRAKAINFGIVYGMGAFSLANDLNIPVYAAKEYILKHRFSPHTMYFRLRSHNAFSFPNLNQIYYKLFKCCKQTGYKII